MKLLSMFKPSRCPAAPSPRGYYLWTDSRTTRILLLGNKPLNDFEANTPGQAQYRALVVALGSAAKPGFQLGDTNVRIYADYVALDRLNEDSLAKALSILQSHLGWDELPILGALSSFTDYTELSRHHDNRWKLGNYS